MEDWYAHSTIAVCTEKLFVLLMIVNGGGGDKWTGTVRSQYNRV